MCKLWIARLLILATGIGIGVFCAAVHYELEGIEKQLGSTEGNIGSLEYYAKDGIGNEFCFEAYASLGGLHEVKAIINAKPILDWLRPNLRSDAKQASFRMQKILTQFPKKFECDKLFFLDSSLRELGYDL